MPYREARAEERLKQGEITKQRIYDFIVRFTTDNLFPPSTREICEGVHYNSTSSVWEYLRKLETDGKIQLRNEGARCIKLLGFKLVKESYHEEKHI